MENELLEKAAVDFLKLCQENGYSAQVLYSKDGEGSLYGCGYDSDNIRMMADQISNLKSKKQ